MGADVGPDLVVGNAAFLPGALDGRAVDSAQQQACEQLHVGVSQDGPDSLVALAASGVICADDSKQVPLAVPQHVEGPPIAHATQYPAQAAGHAEVR